MSDKNIVSGKHTLVEEGTELKGTMSSNCPIVVMGKVEGDITGPIVQVTNTGVIAGKVKVTELRSAGEIAGEIEAETVRISGRVRDKTVIRARTLEVSLSRETGTELAFGECELAIGDEPNKQAAIEAALAPPAPPAPVAPEPAKTAAPGVAKAGRRKGPSEASWDEAAAGSANAPIGPVETEEDGTPRKRKTQPPPLSS
jgi:hypothetical protein